MDADKKPIAACIAAIDTYIDVSNLYSCVLILF